MTPDLRAAAVFMAGALVFYSVGVWSERLVASMRRLWDGASFRELSFDEYFAWSELSLETTTTIGPLSIRARITKHHVPTSALLVEHVATGKKLGISSDTAFDPTLIEFLSPADLVVHETNHGPAHTAYADLLGVDADVKKRMRLIHYPDEFPIATSEIPCLREGDVLDV